MTVAVLQHDRSLVVIKEEPKSVANGMEYVAS